MKVGIPSEVKNHEYRVGATPSMVAVLVADGHSVVVQAGAGERIGFLDTAYVKAGATIAKSAADVYTSEMIIKVKEPQPEEYDLLKEGQILFTFLHLAPDRQQTAALLKQGVIGVAYETVTDVHGRLPLLTPMSEAAGRLSVQAAASSLQMAGGGCGLLLGGLPGTPPARLVVIGGGVVGTNAARMAMGLGASVVLFDTSLDRLRELDTLFGPQLETRYATPDAVAEEVIAADVVIGAVLVPGKSAPKLVSREVVKEMHGGAVIVDVAIDQGGCIETSRPTTHDEPTFITDGVVHYCVTNMPAACARTSTMALTHATLPYARALALHGTEALARDPHLLHGLNVYRGVLTHEHVAKDQGLDYTPPEKALGN